MTAATWAVLAVVALTTACAGAKKSEPESTRAPTSSPTDTAASGDDGPPVGKTRQRAAHQSEPIPRAEPLSRLGNPDVYEVTGQQYEVLFSAQGFTQTGLASWYGRKFHGRPTSNGEAYDMFELTAAHKRLPLPTYVRVTNLENDRTLIVRVNDRGPFHDDRIIDLSYAAATRLGFADAGTAPVHIRALTDNGARAEAPPLYLQAGAFAKIGNARALARQLEDLGVARVAVRPPAEPDPLYRVRIGPFTDVAALAATRQRLEEAGVDPRTLRE